MRASISILRASFVNNTDIFTTSRMVSIVEMIKRFISSCKIDWIILKEVGIILEIRGNNSENILRILTFCLLKYQGTSDNEWYCACE